MLISGRGKGIIMNIIAAVDSNWAIGNKNTLLVRIPRDQKMFMEMTSGKVVVMGRKTLESLPQKQPLGNRANIVLSADKGYRVKGATVVCGLDGLFAELKKYDSGDIFVIGGESVYRQLLPYCNMAYITKIERAYDADAYFPRLDMMPEWELCEESEEQTYFDVEYYFLKYSLKKSIIY